jgi:hypothetical protein
LLLRDREIGHFDASVSPVAALFWRRMAGSASSLGNVK